MAEWIAEGRPSLDLSPLDIRRYPMTCAHVTWFGPPPVLLLVVLFAPCLASLCPLVGSRPLISAAEPLPLVNSYRHFDAGSAGTTTACRSWSAAALRRMGTTTCCTRRASNSSE